MATKRTRKIPRKLLSWGVTVIAIAAVTMVVIRFRQNPKGERIAAKEAKDQKVIEQDKPGDPYKLASKLAQSATDAVNEKAKQERLRASQAQNPSTPIAGASGNRPDWTQVPGGQPTGSPTALDQYEQAKQRVAKAAASTQQLVSTNSANKIAAWEADDTAPAAMNGPTGNHQLDTLLTQIGHTGQTGTPAAATPANEEVDKLVAAQTQAANNLGSRGQVHANEQWINSVADRKADSYAVAKPPLSPYTLYRDDWIPCSLMGATNSDMPGDIGCQVIRNVYDSVTGTILLIPKYSILSGPYNSDIAAGQERLLVAFHRLRYPSGATVDLGAMSGADTTGQSGLSADVNSHFWSIFGSSFLISGMAAIVSRSQASNGTSITINTTAANSLSGAAGEAMLETVKRILDRNSGIKPTLTKEGAAQILVYVNRDLVLPPQVTLTHQ